MTSNDPMTVPVHKFEQFIKMLILKMRKKISHEMYPYLDLVQYSRTVETEEQCISKACI